MDYQFLPQMVDRFELVELHGDERIDRFLRPWMNLDPATQKSRLYAYYKSVHETRLLLHAFRKLSGRRDRSVYILAYLRARYRKSESERELGTPPIKKHCKGL